MIVETLRLAAASLVRSPRRTVLTAGALANAVVGGLLFYGFTRHTYWGLAESFARGGNGHVQIADVDWFDAPTPEAHRVDHVRLEAVRAALLADPEVGPRIAGSSVRRQVMGMLNAGGRSGVFVGVGTEPEAESLIAPVAAAAEGRPLTSADTAGVVLGGTLGARLEVSPGDTVTALVTTDRGLTNAMDLEVVGFARSGVEDMDRTLATLPLPTALALVDGTEADVLVLALDDTDATDAVLTGVRRVLTAGGYTELAAEPWYARARYYQAVRALYDRIFGVFEALMALVTVLSLSHAVAAVVAERRQEIAMLRVIGLRRRDVAALFVAEGGLLGALGCVGGVGIAAVVAWTTERLGGIPMPPPPGFSVGYAAMFRIDALGYAIVLPVTFLAAVFASALPAWRATSGELSRGLSGMVALFALAIGTRSAFASGLPEDLSKARALLVAADAAAAPPASKRCVVDLTVSDSAGTTGWRVALAGPDTLVVSTTLAPGRGQAVLQRAGETWFQTEAMHTPMKVGASQRLTGQLSVGDLLAPHLAETWEPTSWTPGSPAAVAATARPGSGAQWPSAELELTGTRLSAARFYAPSGKLVRSATWQWESGVLRGLDVREPSRGDARTTVSLDPPRCGPVSEPLSPDTLLLAARALAEEAK